jgi:hypothetical protein
MLARNETPEAPVAAPQLSAEQFAQLLQAVVSQKQTLDADALQAILAETAKVSAEAMHRKANPSNQTHPGISVFSHPKGDREMPKPPLPYQLFWNGYPIHKFPETETWSEWMAFSNMPPVGKYTVLRNDASKMVVEVSAETDVDGKPTKVLVRHDSLRADKDKIPPKTVILQQMHGKENPKAAFLAAMQTHLAEMFGEV